ncbi:hypothetical protein ACQUSR_20710 [Streptomyces sp. P1-3]|uniref:hypothetical protein n=1 Tax=Streptomyces sp. P1-3 TaxID=3421658 RepID=UPI003D35DF8A
MDHGEDFGAWMGDEGAEADHRSEEQWALIAGYVRHAANKIGPDLPLCLPGEPQECGHGARQHALVWAVALKAAAQHMIEQAAPAPAHAAYASGPLYERRLAELRATESRSDAGG